MLDSNGAWKTSDSQIVDFSDFPNFDQTQGETGTSLAWIPETNNRLFTVSADFSSINVQHFQSYFKIHMKRNG